MEAEVSQDGEPAHTEHGEAWIDVVEDGRKLRWGAVGPHEYQGELDVDFVADGTSQLTVRLHTEHTDGPSVERALRETVAGIKERVEAEAARPRRTPGA